jgi:hypothetical protein
MLLLYCIILQLHCTILLLTHVYSYMLDHAELELEETAKQKLKPKTPLT